ncbi:hypothetical protein PSM_B0056 [Pseudoalteromonas sp. SM9913]|nr:hypothetical protein PSM_B0056 [Pseudoalteromonas sp. SM9913]
MNKKTKAINTLNKTVKGVYKTHWLLGFVDLSRLNLQQIVWYLGKAEPMWCGCSP